MLWPDDIAGSLPPPQGASEQALRNDILDELNDHLECAMHRERRRHEDDDLAHRAVLVGFGDPARIAYRLWFDALKERIIMQRISLMTNLVLTAVCVLLCVFVGLLMKQNASATEQVLEQLEAMQTRASDEGNDPLMVWASLTVRTSCEDERAFDLVDRRVTLSGEPFNAGRREGLEVRTDAHGVAEYEAVRPGRYTLRVEGAGLEYSNRIVLYPGANECDSIDWPQPDARPTVVAFDRELPDSLALDQSYLWCEVERRPLDPANVPESWRWQPLQVLIAPDGRVMQVDGDHWPFVDLEKSRARSQSFDWIGVDPEAVTLSDHLTLDASFEYRLHEIQFLVADPTFGETEHRYLEIGLVRRPSAGAPRREGWNDSLTGELGAKHTLYKWLERQSWQVPAAGRVLDLYPPAEASVVLIELALHHRSVSRE